MTGERELWAVASHYVVRHGEDAPLFLAMRADELLDRGELAGFRTFVAIKERSEQLLSKPRGPLH